MGRLPAVWKLAEDGMDEGVSPWLNGARSEPTLWLSGARSDSTPRPPCLLSPLGPLSETCSMIVVHTVDMSPSGKGHPERLAKGVLPDRPEPDSCEVRLVLCWWWIVCSLGLVKGGVEGTLWGVLPPFGVASCSATGGVR